MIKLVMALFLFTLVTAARAQAPIELQQGLLAEIYDVTFNSFTGMTPEQAHYNEQRADHLNYALQDILRAVHRDAPKRRYDRLLAFARAKVAEGVSVRFGLMGHTALARGLYLQQSWQRDLGVPRDEAQYRWAADFLTAVFVVAREASRQDVFVSRQRAVGHADFGQRFAQRVVGSTAGIADKAIRLRLPRQVVGILVWDLSRDPSTTQSAALGEARTALAAGGTLEEEIQRLETLQVFPIAPLRTTGVGFGFDRHAPERALGWLIFTDSFRKARACGEVLCVTTNGRGTYFSSADPADGEPQEQVIHECLYSAGLPEALPEHGLYCREALVCNRPAEASPDCNRRFTDLIDTRAEAGRQSDGRETRTPWWLRMH